MRAMGIVRSSGKTGVMACAIVAMGFLLAPVHSDGDAASAPQAPIENVTVLAKTSPVAARKRQVRPELFHGVAEGDGPATDVAVGLEL